MKMHTHKHWLLLAAICAAGSAYAAPSGKPTGRYYFGDGLGQNCTLILSAKGRFDFKWRGCEGLYGSNDGPYRVIDGIVILSPRKPNGRNGALGTSTKFLIVDWGRRRYLIPPEDVRGFCAAVNRGSEPRTLVLGQYYLRLGDEKKAAGGDPDLPAKWKSLLKAKKDRGKPTWLEPKDSNPKLRGLDFKVVQPRKARARRSNPQK